MRTDSSSCKMARQIVAITVIIQIIIFAVFYNLRATNIFPEEHNRQEKQEMREAGIVSRIWGTSICPEELHRKQKQELREAVINSGTAADDPKVLQYLRQYALEPPSTGVYKFSHKTVHMNPLVDVVNKILNNKNGGFFVECGGYDGETASNTIKLEVQQAWKGVLIEMDPALYMQIRGKNRGVWSLNGCLSAQPYPVEMRYSQSLNPQASMLVGANKNASRIATADCFPLYSILLALNRTRVDYFSLDVEGQELAVLRTIPFKKLDIRILSVEYNHVPGKDVALRRFMQSRGYKQYTKVDKDYYQYDMFTHDLVFVKK